MEKHEGGGPPSYNQMYDAGNACSLTNFQTASAPPDVREEIMSSMTVNVAPTAMMVNSNPPVGPNSTQLICPQCRCRIKTEVRHRATVKTHLACLMLSWTFICCCLPYCLNSCRNANHFCPMCGVFIGTYQS